MTAHCLANAFSYYRFLPAKDYSTSVLWPFTGSFLNTGIDPDNKVQHWLQMSFDKYKEVSVYLFYIYCPDISCPNNP